MPVYQELVNFDTLFSQLKEPPLIINDFVDYSEEKKEEIQDLISTRLSSDMLSMMPSCECGETKGEHAIGAICKSCGEPVRSSIEEDIEPFLWFRRPKGVNKLINPAIWSMINDRFKKSGFQVVRWICDPNYRTPVRQPKIIINSLVDRGIQRGYNYFVANFDMIMDLLFSMKDFRLKKGEDRDYLRELLRRERDSIFCEYLPVPNRNLMIIENTNVARYRDPIIDGSIDAILMLASIDSPSNQFTGRVRENRTVKAIAKFAEYYENFEKTNLAGKQGIFRKHIFGTRSHFSFRAVIASLTEPHAYDEIHVPWSIGVTVFRVHLINKLLRRGFSHNQAVGHIYAHVEKYDPLLHELITIILTESPYGGHPAIIQRNPSMLQGSAQAVRITKVKTDPRDSTVSMSILIVTAPNADFDGDALNISLSVDNFMASKWQELAPHRNVFVMDKAFEVSGNLSIPKTVIATMSNWLNNNYVEEIDPEKQKRFDLLPEV